MNDFTTIRKKMTDEKNFSECVPADTASFWGDEEKRDIDEIVDLIIEKYPPEKIPLSVFLFGSFAYGQPNKDSDYDICLITHEKLAYAVSSSSTKVLLKYDEFKGFKKGKNRRRLEIIVGSERKLASGESSFSCLPDIYKKGILLYKSELSPESARWKKICTL